jgi:thioredoxin reductase (NADPH)
MFMMTSAIADTRWLDGCVVLDEKGFIKTGPDLSREELATAGWPPSRPPFLPERHGRSARRRRARATP